MARFSLTFPGLVLRAILKNNLSVWSSGYFMAFWMSWVGKFLNSEKSRKAVFWKHTSQNKKSYENRPPQNQPKNYLIDRAKPFQLFLENTDSGENVCV